MVEHSKDKIKFINLCKLYEKTGEYFALDRDGREFLVGELSGDGRDVVLEDEFEILN